MHSLGTGTSVTSSRAVGSMEIRPEELPEFYSFWLIGARIFAIWNTTKLYQINLKYQCHYCHHCISKISKWYNMRNFEKHPYINNTAMQTLHFSSRNLQDQKLITTSQRWLCRETRIYVGCPRAEPTSQKKITQVNHCCLGPALFVAHLIAQPTSRQMPSSNSIHKCPSKNSASLFTMHLRNIEMPWNGQVGSSRYETVGPGIANPAQQFNDGNTGDCRGGCAETDETGRGCLSTKYRTRFHCDQILFAWEWPWKKPTLA